MAQAASSSPSSVSRPSTWGSRRWASSEATHALSLRRRTACCAAHFGGHRCALPLRRHRTRGGAVSSARPRQLAHRRARPGGGLGAVVTRLLLAELFPAP